MDKKLTGVILTLTSHPDGAVPCNSVIKGNLEYEFTASEELRGIYIRVNGETTTNFMALEGKKPVEHGYWLMHLDNHVVLWGQSPSDSPTSVQQVPVGPANCPFTLRLPPNLPESFEGANGYTRYYLTAVFDRPTSTFNYEKRLLFTVVKESDLNKLSHTLTENGVLITQENVMAQEIHYVRWPCFPNMGPDKLLQYELHLSKLGYVPGEHIIVFGCLRNATGTRLKRPRLRLVQRATYYGVIGRPIMHGDCTETHLSPYWDEVRVVVEVPLVNGDVIESGQVVNFGLSSADPAAVHIAIPPVPSSRSDDSPINIFYSLEIFSKSVVDEKLFMVFIGTVPLENLELNIANTGQHHRVYRPNVFGRVHVNWAKSQSPFTDPKNEDPSTTPERLLGEIETMYIPRYATFDETILMQESST